jgi:iron complex outermembrane receptor protein
MKKIHLIRAGAGLGLLIPATGWAQSPVAGGTGQSSAEAQAAPASEADDQEILVTAQRREQRLQDVPLSVTALSGDTLAERGINDITTLSTSVPG